jgi:hypothetical protein
MVPHMKTTVEIADRLMTEAKRLAERRGTTVRALIEEGLRRVLRDSRAREPFRLRRASFRGQGASPYVEEGRWDRVRELIYEGRGE